MDSLSLYYKTVTKKDTQNRMELHSKTDTQYNTVCK